MVDSPIVSDVLDPGILLNTLVAFQKGKFSARLPVDLTGVPGKIADTLNSIFEMNERLRDELARVSSEVGKEGRIAERAHLPAAGGDWTGCVNSVNELIGDLVRPSTEVARVIGAVAKGDLSQTMAMDVDGRPLRGEFLHTTRTVNRMVDQLNSFASEVTRVAREVGTEGKLGGQANVKVVAGVWKDLTDSVNSMAGNLTAQVRSIADVTTAVAKGDLSRKVTVEVRGEILELKNTINTMVDQLSSFASEVTRVAREVGTEGKLGGQAEVRGVGGVWQDLTENVNLMAANLTDQVRNIADVTTAVAKGDLSRKITVEVRGEILELKNTINTMVDQLNAFASEVVRVAREVGTEGKLGGQAEVSDVAGVWKDLTDSVNSMTGNLTAQVRNIANVATAVAQGDLSTKITVTARGEILELKDTINTMVDQLNAFASEVTRVAREVGTEGKLGGQADVRGVAGTWKDLTESVNSMASNLTAQVRNIAEVTTAVARGDLSRKITVLVRGEILELKDTINVMVDQLNAFANEVTRVAREVGTEGRLGGQADVQGVAGVWKDLTDSVNSMAGNLTGQVRNIADVTTAVAKGDLSRKITVEVRGEILELKNTINTMVDQLSSFASEVTRVAREVGTEGKLGGQADVRGVAGTWKDLTESVNSMASNLTDQVRNIADVTTAVARGDLSRKITVDVRGEILELKETINTMVGQLNSFASEVTRVAREVGTEGKLGGQANVSGVAGTWKDLTDSVNSMASNLTNQVRNIAEVTTAVARGDLSRKITVDVRGEILSLKDTINTMVDQLSSFASEVTRVAREVGTEGKLGGQADVKGVAGVWQDLTDSVNSMAGNLTAQVRNIADVTTAVARGDLSRKITVDVRGEILALKETINTMVDQLSSFASEVTRVAKDVGTEGKLGGQANVPGVAGTWKDLTDSVNSMASNLTNQVRNIAEVTTAVARGDLSRKITVDVRGEILSLKDTINTMVDQLNSFASEVTRVAREVGTEGKLAGQADVRGVAGTWKDLTDNVNLMAANLTTQVRGIAKVVTSVANGDLTRKLVLETKGEIAALADIINAMIDTLATFADQVTTVAREVGIEGKLGGQARVPGAAGRWRDLTDNVNQLAANLTTQVRAIADVASAVTSGDLTRSISVEAQGEVAGLKDTINQMIVNLAQTTRKNTEQDWLKTNIARFTRLVQGQRDLLTVSQLLLSEMIPLVGAQRGTFYLLDREDEGVLKLLASYAHHAGPGIKTTFRMGEGILGEAAITKRKMVVGSLPQDYFQIVSSLGSAPPKNVIVLPILYEGEVMAVIELAAFDDFSDVHMSFLDQLAESMGIVLNTVAATMRTEKLLKQSQALAEELQKTNAELEEKAQLLAEQKNQVETKNQEVEQAKAELEEKAEQLALTSKYKSEFLANMSHELRTPLNNLLILARMLSENTDKNLTSKQVKYAETIHTSGTDLLALISDILDLSKIESGKMDVDIAAVRLVDLREYCLQTFRHVAEGKMLDLSVELDSRLGDSMYTDAKRLQQVLKNLLSNALKFTAQGSVKLEIKPASSGWWPDHPVLSRARSVVAFAVRDTGIGIPKDKQNLIFEAFQQADGTTSRKYGGTGLGLSISRELARLLGGEIQLESVSGEGSVFTLFLPQNYDAGAAVPRPEIPSVARSSGGRSNGGEQALLPSPALAKAAAAALVEDIPVEDDRGTIESGDPILLIVEDDSTFARVLVDLAHEHNLKALVALRGATALTLAREFAPSVITLDIALPDMPGWVVLDRLKHDSVTRHIPVHVITGDGDQRLAAALGAMTFLQKAAEEQRIDSTFRIIGDSARPRKKRLVALCNPADRQPIYEAIAGEDIEISWAQHEEEFEYVLNAERTDGILVVGAPSMAVVASIQRFQSGHAEMVPPLIVYTAKPLSAAETSSLSRLAGRGAVRYAPSLDRVLEETVVLLHRREAQLSTAQRQQLSDLRDRDPLLSNKKVLVVDDDLRNIFALTSVLERHSMTVLHAENGRAAIELLERQPDFDAVLMDIMMPEMDGYETMRAIRSRPQFAKLPIVALTAKAMVGDRQKCLEAGASDYVAKPVDLDQLFSVLRVLIWRSLEAESIYGASVRASESARPRPRPRAVADDRDAIQPGDRVLLIIEDDPTFAQILTDMAHEHHLKVLVELTGATAVALAREFRPNAITLDISLPDMAGWSILDRLKHDSITRHIPVHIISGDDDRRRGLALGAMTFIQKAGDTPLSTAFDVIGNSTSLRQKKVLVLSNDPQEIQQTLDLQSLQCIVAPPVIESLSMLEQQYLDCIVIDADTGFTADAIAEVQEKVAPYTPPVVAYCPRNVEADDSERFAKLAKVSPVRLASLPENLLDETIRLLGIDELHLTTEQRELIGEARRIDSVLVGKRVLVVDDDVAGLFTLSSVLHHQHMEVVQTENGRYALEKLATGLTVHCILMDVMMPEMDGLETTRRIRQMPGLADVPIVAFTGKALAGDRERCLAAGASEYVTKPVDLDQLLSIIRVHVSASEDGHSAKNPVLS